MLSPRFVLLAQYPAFFLLAVLFLINYLTVRRRSAVKSVLWVLLFGVALAVSILFCFLGMQAEFWALKTLFTLSVWSWIGVVLVVLAVIVRFVFKVKGKLDQHTLKRELKKAEQDKAAAVAQAREEGRAEAMSAPAPEVTPIADTAPAAEVAPVSVTEEIGSSPADSSNLNSL